MHALIILIWHNRVSTTLTVSPTALSGGGPRISVLLGLGMHGDMHGRTAAGQRPNQSINYSILIKLFLSDLTSATKS